MLERFWKVKVHKYAYKNHAASKLYRDMDIIMGDDEEPEENKVLASICKTKLKLGLCIYSEQMDIGQNWREGELHWKLGTMRSWSNWRWEVER